MNTIYNARMYAMTHRDAEPSHLLYARKLIRNAYSDIALGKDVLRQQHEMDHLLQKLENHPLGGGS